MKRYNVGIGDDFPVNDGDHGWARHGCGWGGHWGSTRPWGRHGGGRGGLLKVLFVLALAVIVISHPVHALVLLGLAILITRSRWPREAWERWQRGGMAMDQGPRSRGPGGTGAFV